MLNPDFRDMLSAFSAANVEYLVVGAYALAAQGIPRATGDLYLWIRPESGNAERVLAALVAFGAPTDQIAAADLCTPDVVFQIGVQPSRIDILTSVDGLDFDEAWRERMISDVERVRIPVLSREHLIRNKRSVGRPQDLADVAALEALRESP